MKKYPKFQENRITIAFQKALTKKYPNYPDLTIDGEVLTCFFYSEKQMKHDLQRQFSLRGTPETILDTRVKINGKLLPYTECCSLVSTPLAYSRFDDVVFLGVASGKDIEFSGELGGGMSYSEVLDMTNNKFLEDDDFFEF